MNNEIEYTETAYGNTIIGNTDVLFRIYVYLYNRLMNVLH